MPARIARMIVLATALLLAAAASAAALSGPIRTTPTATTPKHPVGTVVVKTQATLPGATYRWAQPVFTTAHGIAIARAPK